MIVFLLGHLPQDLVMEGSKRAGDIRIDVSIDIESITTMFYGRRKELTLVVV